MLITIKKLPANSWQQYKNIRLQALQADPIAFGETYEQALTQTEEDWRRRIAPMWFALAEHEVVGMIGLLQETNASSKHKANMISMWIKPEFRGQGIGKKLIQELQTYAPTVGILKIYLYVTTTQISAIELYKALGFTTIGICKKNSFIQNQYFDQYLMEWLVE